MKPKIKFALNLVYTVVVIALIILGAGTAISAFAGPDNWRLFIVQSGSMEPVLKTGSVVLVQPIVGGRNVLSPIPSSLYQKGDIITYLSGKNFLTHRLVNVEKANSTFIYETKGDANKGPDREKIQEKQIIGKVTFSIPYLGQIVSFARTQMGYISLIVIPVTLIIYSEILNINKEIRAMIENRKRKELAV